MLDIKSKKWYRLGYLIIFLVIASVTAGMMSLYPYLSRQFYGRYTNTLVSAYESGYYDYFEFLAVTTLMILVLTAITVFAALIIPCFKMLKVEEHRIFKLSFETASVIAIIASCLVASEILTEMIDVTIEGDFYYSLLNWGIDAYTSEALCYGVNIAVWAVYFSLVYWSATCYRAVFSLGFIKYLKERTLVFRFFFWAKDKIYTCYSSVSNVDFRDSSNKFILKLVAGNFVLLTFICCFWFAGIGALIIYSIILFIILRKCFLNIQGKYGVLLRATNQIGEGNLDVEITEDLGMFEPFKDEIQKIQLGFKQAVEEEVKSQSMRTELITNVSHDLKTPLTAIITYVNLLKKEDLTKEEQKSYIQVLDQKSMRLKSLIEDLFELSKVNSRNITLNLEQVDIVDLLKQVKLELEDQISVSSLDFRFEFPGERILLQLDSEKTYRVFENLLMNIIKYGMPGTRVYVDMQVLADQVVIFMKNVSANEIKINASDLTERFVRGDQARNTEGSGLGLAIAKSFVELQKGKMDVEVEADLFKVKIIWPLAKDRELEKEQENKTGEIQIIE